MPHTDAQTFRQRLKAKQKLYGTFVKTPTSHATEILGDLGYDFVIIDSEHAPIDRMTIDVIVLAGRAANISTLVRVRDLGDITGALDSGCDGVLVPHVNTPERAREVAASCRYAGGTRGFSSTTRAGRFGAAGFGHIPAQDAAVTCVAMIEDPEAVDQIDAIAAVEGIDAFFLGRGDLTAALGQTAITSPETLAAVRKIAEGANKVGKPLIALPSNADDARIMHDLGVTGIVIANDQGFMAQAARKALADFSAAIS